MVKKFQRKIEDFICKHCGKRVKGNGYTNHCPYCLWSKHVDIWPGDRQNKCQGMMEPIEVYFKNNIWHLIHCCQKCGEKKSIKIIESENPREIEKILKKTLKT